MNDNALPIIGRHLALLVEHDFGDGELFGVLEACREAGAEVTLVGATAPTEYRGTGGGIVNSTLAAADARTEHFDAIVIPGGWAPDRMRMRHAMVDLVREATKTNKPVAAICRGPQLLISANVLRDRMVTCWPSIAVDIKNAGGLYMDKPVVEDGPLITSRKFDDVPHFTGAIIRALSNVPPTLR